MKEYTSDMMIHILRNPHGWSEDAIRKARLEACDEIEKLRKLVRFVENIDEQGVHVSSGVDGPDAIQFSANDIRYITSIALAIYKSKQKRSV